MKKLLPILLIGAGGWFLYRSFASGSTPAAAIVQKKDAGIIPTPERPNTRTLMLAKAGDSGPLNYDDWNWYYREVKGIEPPDVLLYTDSEHRSNPVSIDTWWAGASQFGVTGLGKLRRRQIVRRRRAA